MQTLSFNDYHAYADAISRVDAGFIMQNPEQHLWRISGAQLPGGSRLQHCYSGSGAIASGAGERGGVALAIPAFGHFVANGETVPDDGALFISPRQEFLVAIPGAHSWFNVFLSRKTAENTGLLDDSTLSGRNRNCVLHSGDGRPCAVRALLLRYLMSAQSTPEIAEAAAAQGQFEEDLIAAVHDTYGTPQQAQPGVAGRRALADRIAIQRVIDFINGSASPQLPLQELARVANVSERALRDGFRKHIGLSPSRYMQLRLMDLARQQLLAAQPSETTVARIATDLGAWDQGRFAARYRQLFGELPSTTLNERQAA